jgi:hypothetical protein
MKGYREPSLSGGDIELSHDGSLQVPPSWPDATAMNRALESLPKRLTKYYCEKLKKHDAGIVAELQVMGRLLDPQLAATVKPYPSSPTVEGILTLNRLEYELEIKTLLGTLWESTRAAVCESVEQIVCARYPSWRGFTKLADTEWTIPRVAKHGSPSIDVSATQQKIITEFEELTDRGRLGPPIQVPNRPGRIIVSIDSEREVFVYFGRATRPADHDFRVFEKKLLRALENKEDSQFSGTMPAILACVCLRDPDAPVFLDSEYGIANRIFAKYPHISAIVALPYCSYTQNTFSVATRDESDEPGIGPILRNEDRESLLRLFRMPHLGIRALDVEKFMAMVKELPTSLIENRERT